MTRHADQAMYRAKELGKNRWQMFESSPHVCAETHMKAIDLRQERGEFVAVYQPKVQLQTQEDSKHCCAGVIPNAA